MNYELLHRLQIDYISDFLKIKNTLNFMVLGLFIL